MYTLNPQIFVVCLASYTTGRIHGAWINAAQDAECIMREIKNMLANGPMSHAEEWAIHCTDDFGCLKITDYTDIEDVADMGCFIKEHGELGAALIDHFGQSINDAKTAMEKNYHGQYKSEAHFARAYVEDFFYSPANLADYINYEKLANDLLVNDYFDIKLEGEVHVFNHF